MSKKKLEGLNKTAKKSKWIEQAKFRLKNRKWLNYSSQVARRILARIDELPDYNQAKLATILKVSPQQVSKIVKGNENLTLETIANISEVLGVELIIFPDYAYSKQYTSNKVVIREKIVYIVVRPDHTTNTYKNNQITRLEGNTILWQNKKYKQNQPTC